MFLEELDIAIEAYQQAQHAFANGDPRPVLNVFSERDDVTLSNPLGPPRRGRAEVEKAIEDAAAAADFKGGSMRFEEVSRYSTSELACVHDIQRTEAHVAGSETPVRISLRVTTIFRREGDTWKVALRHADPITTARPIMTAIEA